MFWALENGWGYMTQECELKSVSCMTYANAPCALLGGFPLVRAVHDHFVCAVCGE